MSKADLGLVSIKPGVLQIAYPSKTMMYLSMGLPVLALAESDSSLAKFILNNKLGYVSDSITHDNLVDAIIIAEQNKNVLRQERNRIERVAFDTFGEDVILGKWVELINKIEQSSSKGRSKSC